jgi:hypothetical protein
MQIEIAKELEPAINIAGTKLNIQARFLPESEVLKSYLERPYGNAYDFGQEDPVAGIFA